MIRFAIPALIAWTLFLYATIAQAQHTLILAIDVSASVDDEEQRIQMEGYGSVLQFFPYLEGHHVEVILFSSRAVSVSSGTLSDAQAFFDNWYIPEEVYGNGYATTCVNRMLRYVLETLDQYPGVITLDISGDGEENCSRDEQVVETTDQLDAAGVLINALVIQDRVRIHDSRKAIEFYTEHVINGYLFLAESFLDVAETLHRKIALEMSHVRAGSAYAYND